MTDPQANVMPSGEATAEVGPVQRIVGVLVDPAETFADIARKPDFWVPLILMMILSVAFVELFLSKVSMQAMKSHGGVMPVTATPPLSSTMEGLHGFEGRHLRRDVTRQ